MVHLIFAFEFFFLVCWEFVSLTQYGAVRSEPLRNVMLAVIMLMLLKNKNNSSYLPGGCVTQLKLLQRKIK